ncbi:MAG: hypothetical protein POELPBGB_01377 [Bacteroidia bacterium]|nr:hypothetical protein [Bacteroidia bacterium]
METFINQLCSSYIKGGSIWPQIRGGINIYMLGTIAKIQLTERFDWRNFLDSELSEKQLASAYEVMERLHIKSGIILSIKVDLQDEWRSAKAAIFKSFLYFILEGIPQYNSSIKELLTLRNADIIQKFTDEVPIEQNAFYKICESAKSELIKYTDLAELFVYSVSKNYETDTSRYEGICKKYYLSLSKVGDVQLAKNCLNIVRTNLDEHLKINYSTQCYSAVCWGFDLPHYLN